MRPIGTGSDRALCAARRAPALLASLVLSGCLGSGGPNEATRPALAGTGPTADAPLPRLVLQITVDQLRGDLPLRYRERFGPDGFRYLMERGTWYAAARHGHAHTETVVGHTTLATGADPAQHGMIANSWYDRATRQLVKNVQDPAYTSRGEAVEQTPGSSPSRILTTSFSDELAISTAGHAKIFGVSVKDRGAIPLAGHTGKAFWLSTSSGRFVSSSYYYERLPRWVADWNEQRKAYAYSGQTWDLLADSSRYLNSATDNSEYAAGTRAAATMEALAGIGWRDFPHAYKTLPAPQPDSLFFFNGVAGSPAGDELTLDFVMELVAKEGLGADDVPDYLAISFSANDLVLHMFGPSSLESEDILLRLDTVLARLFAFVDRQVGLENTLIVLAGDHGGPDVPEYLRSLNVNGGRISKDSIEAAGKRALSRYSGGDSLLAAYQHPYFYFRSDVIDSLGLDPLQVQRDVAEEVAKLPGVAMALATLDLRRPGGAGESDIIERVRRNDDPVRSGDVYVVQEAQWLVDASAGDEPFVMLNHGSPWNYDTYVPVVFAGMNVPAMTVSRPIETVDVAVTLAAVLRTKLPSGSVGVPLSEVITGR